MHKLSNEPGGERLKQFLQAVSKIQLWKPEEKAALRALGADQIREIRELEREDSTSRCTVLGLEARTNTAVVVKVHKFCHRPGYEDLLQVMMEPATGKAWISKEDAALGALTPIQIRGIRDMAELELEDATLRCTIPDLEARNNRAVVIRIRKLCHEPGYEELSQAFIESIKHDAWTPKDDAAIRGLAADHIANIKANRTADPKDPTRWCTVPGLENRTNEAANARILLLSKQKGGESLLQALEDAKRLVL
jgi:hypothetical protein